TASTSRDLYAQDDLLAFVVNAIVVNEIAPEVGGLDSPASETARDFGHIVLRISAIHAKSMQLHQLTSVVFIQTASLFPLGLELQLFGSLAESSCRRPLVLLSVWRYALPIVQVEQHCGTRSCGFQQIAKLAEDVRSNGVAFVRCRQDTVSAFIQVY